MQGAREQTRPPVHMAGPFTERSHSPRGTTTTPVETEARRFPDVEQVFSHVIVVKSPAVTKCPGTYLERKCGRGARKYFGPSPERSSIGQKQPLFLRLKCSSSRPEASEIGGRGTFAVKARVSRDFGTSGRAISAIRAIVARDFHSVAGPDKAIRAEDTDDFIVDAG